MTKAETTTARSPRGAKPVSQAFFKALETIPEASRTAVARAAQALIRDQIKMQREKAKATAAKARAGAAKDKARPSVMKKSIAAATTPKAGVASEAQVSPVKRRSRKSTEAPAAA